MLAATRVDLARSGLIDGLTTTQLANVLGFSESSAVSRFLREHGLTTEDWRSMRSAAAKGVSIEDVTGAIYDSESTERWSRAALTVGSFLEGALIRVWVTKPSTKEVTFDFLTPGLPSFLPSEYDEHYFESDPRIPAVLSRLGTPVSCADAVDPAEFDKSSLVNDLLDRPGIGVRWCMIQAAWLRGGLPMFFAAGRARARGPFCEPDTRRMAAAFARLKPAIAFDRAAR